MEKYLTNSEEETFALGARLAKDFKCGSVAALTGELGSGKTALIRGIVSALGDETEVSSPTYTLVNEYDCSIPVYHFDVYRLEGADVKGLDWIDDYLFGNGICLIEWAEHIKSILPEDTVYISFCKTGENSREITVK